MANDLGFKPKIDVGFKPKTIPGTLPPPPRGIAIDQPVLKAAPEEPTWRQALKQFAFPPELGYGVRPTEVTRPEKLWRAVEFTPRVGLGVLGGAIERVFNKLPASVIEPPMAAIGKGRFETIKTEELKKWPRSVFEGLKALVAKPGVPTPEAPGYGEVWARSWREPLTGEPAKEWEKAVQDIAFTALTMFGPKAFEQFKTAKARNKFFGKVDKITSKYGKAIEEAKARGDPTLHITVNRLKRLQQRELQELVLPKITRIKAPTIKAPPTEYAKGEVIAKAEQPLQKLTRLIKSASRVEKQQKQLRHKEMQRRVGRYATILEKGKGERAFYGARGALRGQLPTAEFTPPELSMSPAEMNALVEQLRVSKKLLPLQKGNAFDGLKQLFSGQLPQRNKLQLLEKEFGPELIKAVLAKRPTSVKAWQNLVDAANLPRTLLTSYDLSASLRQNYIAGLRHPVKWAKAFAAQIKAVKSEKAALAVEETIKSSKYYPLAAQNKLYLPEIKSVATGLSARPEEFMSRFARAVPGVKLSERAFITMGNKMRFELWSKYCKLWEGTGKSAADYQALAKHINAITGRGDLPRFMARSGAELNALFFSPRYLASRFQVIYKAGQYPVHLATGKDPVSKIAAADAVTFVGTNLSVLAAMKLYWGDKIDVEIDPRSSDFGKIRVGNMRFDIWAGFQPLARYIAQGLAGERKTTLTKKIVEQPRLQTAGRFVRSKLAPAPAFIVDLYTGNSFIGDEMTIQSTPRQLRERFVPLAFQDVYEAVKYQGGGESWLSLPAAQLGIGVVTWEPTNYQQLALLKDELARKNYGVEWEKLGPLAQRILTAQNPEIQELKRAADYKRKDFPFVEDMLREQLKVGRTITNSIAPIIQKEMKRLQITIGPIPRSIGKWTMNDERYKEYQDLIAKHINERADSFSSESWLGMEDNYKRKMIENILDSAKRRARNEIKTKARSLDVEAILE